MIASLDCCIKQGREMAPKKKPHKASSTSKSKQQTSFSSSSSSAVPRLQISAQNETRLRRLLLNSDRSLQQSATPIDEETTLSISQKTKKLKSIYEKLSCEGFSNDQIELALSSLKGKATVDDALDWLCLNLPGNELPLKFSSGTSLYPQEGGSVNVISVARGDWKPSSEPSIRINEEVQGISVRRKGKQHEETLDSFQPSQADWIRQYVEQQEEDETGAWGDDHSCSNEVPEPRSSDVISKEYLAARLEAAKAKERGDKKSQEQAGRIIRKLKQELSAIGLSDDILVSEFANEHASSDISSCSMSCKQTEGITSDGSEFGLAVHIDDDPTVDGNAIQCYGSKVFQDNSNPPFSEKIVVEHESSDVELGDFFIEDASGEKNVLEDESADVELGDLFTKDSSEKKIVLEDESADVELGDFFTEDDSENQALVTQVLNIHKEEKMRELCSMKNIVKLDGIWKKGDARKTPKALLHQLCQKSGWEAPKFNKVNTFRNNFVYTVSVLRKASGRGKSRKAGGLVTLKLPDNEASYESVEDAQNHVAVYALHNLFPDLPVQLILNEPYGSLLLQWKQGETLEKVGDTEEDRRAGFVDRLLNADVSSNTVDVISSTVPEKNHANDSGILHQCLAVPVNERITHTAEMESSFLRQEQEHRKNMQKYEDMLKTRAALPIAGLKGDILHLLKENNVLVVCGETGSGKTTQVPQFILDDMIESGCGGHCNIICTQPRRIAAISVAERVADERCETSPGSNGSLVGYQVRLDSARNDKTKLLFCTTGILLRKFAGNKNLTGVTHVIVDEVHERSLLGDFLIIILKNLLEKQSTHDTPKLKVILMSATVDSNLFSRYFDGCPVLTAQGRTHPVTTYFLEDIYDMIKYKLASDSRVAIRYETSSQDKSRVVTNHRGKKNIVMSAWDDDSMHLEECVNPHFVSHIYQSYSEETQKNLKKLDEDVIDYDVLEDLVCHIDGTCDEGAILIFLPGLAEIHMLVDRLAASYRFRGPSADWILPLHSSLASADQKKVFLRPPESSRKVIVATNIAETSITIDDVVYVIDCGKQKESRYNPRKKLSSMVEDWISQANARQRRGRAGRVKPGICFCLYTHHRFDKLMHPYQLPEMLRMPLVELCLQIKLLLLGDIKAFLSRALEPPREEAMNSAISLLYEVGALEGREELTPLGHHLAKLPVDVLIGKMMLYGGIFGCLSPILSISAFLSYKSPFVYPKDEKQNAERAKLSLLTDKLDGSHDSDGSYRQSDHLTVMVAYKKWEKILRQGGVKAALQFCNSYFLSSPVMYMIRDMRIQFGTLLADIGLINLPRKYQARGKKEDLDSLFSDASQPFNKYSHVPSVIKAILCAGLYPNVAALEQGVTAAVLKNLKRISSNGYAGWYDGRREAHIHPSSVNSKLKAFQHPYLVYLEKLETNKVFVRDTSVVSPFSILMFGGSINIQHQTGLVIIDGWLKVTASAQTAVLFKELRLALHSILKNLIKNPEDTIIVDNEVVTSMVHLLVEEEKNIAQS